MATKSTTSASTQTGGYWSPAAVWKPMSGTFRRARSCRPSWGRPGSSRTSMVCGSFRGPMPSIPSYGRSVRSRAEKMPRRLRTWRRNLRLRHQRRRAAIGHPRPFGNLCLAHSDALDLADHRGADQDRPGRAWSADHFADRCRASRRMADQFDLELRKCLGVFEHGDEIYDFGINADGRLLVTRGRLETYVWHIPTRSILQTIVGPTRIVQDEHGLRIISRTDAEHPGVWPISSISS